LTVRCFCIVQKQKGVADAMIKATGSKGILRNYSHTKQRSSDKSVYVTGGTTCIPNCTFAGV